MKKTIRLSGIAYESLVNGPGMRRVFFAQGCKHNCKGCFNPDTHDFNGGEERNMDELIKDTLDNQILRGVTFSGGDPWEQADKFAYMAKAFKENGLSIWSYTGYTFEYIIKHQNEYNGWTDLLNNIDVLVDGKFEEEKKQDGLKFKGSANQRIIDVKESLRLSKIITIEY
ncbi:anaerobic ribonucleoside-triphosphate reductase activating protein [Clostridium saccharobutylicum]|uniref:Anaerobic ribonucleoside-triphosphate reductase-activating protein n=1 Tax=Clostridium saccharobutylicum TaxID=169679 RepID=A0A1S8N3Z5_CLOSA|nr:anaerobic ribonucleoside-triphosphate reductase activating protein [Clostridium saccharobutylicum]OOM11135.1 pyruvate formate-lyase 1-activating enzyme [Clostridium saccharobutylicum]